MSDDDALRVPKHPEKRRRVEEVPEEDRQEMIHLKKTGYGTRRIADRVGWSRKIVRQILTEEGLLKPEPPQASKLARFEEAIEERVKKRLTTSRILREIKTLGYSGGRTILAERVRALRIEHSIETKQKKKVTRRFETPPGQEMQIDWSPYVVSVGGRDVVVKLFGCLLCACRKLFLYFFDNERQTTLLEGLAMAFEYFDGCTLRVVLDNMTTAIVARYGPHRKPIFQQAFVDFAMHYGFTPYPCQIRDADRKGKKEKSFQLVEADLLRGEAFASMDDLNRQARIWLDQTPGAGNLRVHGTTHQIPNEAYRSERDLLIRLPEKRFPVYEHSIRPVDADCTISVRGNRYSIPAGLANRSVEVRLYAEHFEVLDTYGHLSFSRRYVGAAQKGPPVIDPTHYETLKRRPKHGGPRLHEAFLQRFPELEPLVTGLFEKMKSVTPIHLRALLRLCETYGEEAFVAAAKRAQAYRRFDAWAVNRILQNEHGLSDDAPDAPLGGIGPMRIGEVDFGSLDDYGHLDGSPSDGKDPDEEK